MQYRKMKETIKMQFWHIFTAYYTTSVDFNNFTNVIFVLILRTYVS